jgi:quinol monooxygenase YgiN
MDVSPSLAFGAGALATAGLFYAMQTSSTRETVEKKAFVLLITMDFEVEADVAKFQEMFTPLAKYCLENEPRTLSYELSLSDKDPKRILIVERYVCKADLTDVHQKSAPFLEFKRLMGEVDLKRKTEGHSYYETNVGYM